jgi:TetR/AcrR family transcriptional regulator, cholesterol catabolism regulator
MAEARQSEQRIVVEQRILSKARAMFNRYGYVATTMRQIAKDVGMEAQSLYNYFPSKQDIFAALMHRGTAVLRERVETAIAEAEPQPRAQLWAAMKAHTLHYCDFEEVMLTRDVLPHVDADLRAVSVAVLKSYEDIFKRILADGIEAGQFRPADISPTSFALLGMGESVINWYRPSGRLPAEEIAVIYADLALNMVAWPSPPDQ